MTNGSIDYLLGQISAQLKANEDDHNEIKNTLKDIQHKLDTTCLDLESLKTKARIWGAITGAVAGFVGHLIMVFMQWFLIKR